METELCIQLQSFKAEKGLIWKHDFWATNDATNAENFLIVIAE